MVIWFFDWETRPAIVLREGAEGWAFLSSNWVEVNPSEIIDSGKRIPVEMWPSIFPNVPLPEGPLAQSRSAAAWTTAPQQILSEGTVELWRKNARVERWIITGLLVAGLVVLFWALPSNRDLGCQECEWSAR